MPKAYLLDQEDNADGKSTVHIDFRSNRPVTEQADSLIHTRMGLLVIDWWENGGPELHYLRCHIEGQRMRCDVRWYLRQDMARKGYGRPFQFLRLSLNGPSWLDPYARINAQEIGRTFQAWNNDKRKALIDEAVTLTDGTEKRVRIDLRPYLNQLLRGMEKRRQREREAEKEDSCEA